MSKIKSVASILALAVLLAGATGVQTRAGGPSAAARYTSDGRMVFPADFRRWVYLSSGLGMSYVENAGPGASVFDNVFVNPGAYEAFLTSGTWPNGTVMVLEHRLGEQKGSINRNGHFQGARAGIEVHVKDTARFKGGWAFFSFPSEAPATIIAQSVSCYACHTAHAAVDTTFVQFYPTLLSVAKAKKTFSTAYLAETEAAKR